MNLSLSKIKESTSRMSLTLVLSIFVFSILMAAIGMTALGLLVLGKLGMLVDVNGVLQLGSVILAMTIISLVIGGVLTFFSSRIPLKPINNLINKMNRLAAGDFKARLEFGPTLSSHPAFQEISTSFNTMAEELGNTEMLRHDFIDNFSHEFKTPLISIKGFAKLLAREDLTDEQRAIYVHAIEEETARLSSMANNVLNLTRIENQAILKDVTSFNLSEQLRSSLLMLENKWERKEIELAINLEEHTIEANEEMLKEVWINLFDNAVKFSPCGGTVGLEVADEGDTLSVKISNACEDIPPERLEKIFNKFYQVDESHSTKGNGIGLAIVKQIVMLHRGEVAVSSEEGLVTFTVTLPKVQ